MSVANWLDVETKQYRRRAITDYVIEPFVQQNASTAPNRVGEMLSLAGYGSPLKLIDSSRRVAKGTTEEQLKIITERRNRIAHASDRLGRRTRATISVGEAATWLSHLREIVSAIDSLPWPAE